MATDIPLLRAARVSPPGVLPTVSDVNEWTQKELFCFIQSENIFWTSKERRRFKKAGITGEYFLTHGNTLRFWHSVCDLPAGLCIRLVTLVEKIKGIGEEGQSQGNFFLGWSDVVALSNWPIQELGTQHRRRSIP